jgi:lipoprotein-releasing system ATP-binding protein
MTDAPLVEIRGLSKTYVMPERSLNVLQGVDLVLRKAEMISLEGQSGVGKSTFLHILGTLDSPSEGTVHFEGRDVFTLAPDELARFRNATIGFVFQFHHLLPEFTALENVMMPALIGRQSSAEALSKAQYLLERVGLADRSTHRPSELSGGEQQRVAIARSLMQSPRLVLADEPTGNLDQRTSREIHDLLVELNEETGITFLVATHNPTLAGRMTRHLVVQGAQILERTPAGGPA